MSTPSFLPKHDRRPSRTALVALMVAGIVAVFASAASAHTSTVTHTESCPADGATMTVVTFDNDYNLPATVTYHWGSDAASTTPVDPKIGSDNGTVSLPKHAVGTLTYHVTWSDNYRQPPGQDESTLTIGPLTGCHAAETTTTTLPSTTTTTTALATTTTTEAATTTTTAGAVVAAVTTTSGPATTVLGETLTQPAVAPDATLPRTGSSTGTTVTLAAVILAIGLMALRIGRAKTPAGS